MELTLQMKVLLEETLIQEVGWPVLLNLNKSGFVASRARNKDKELTTIHAPFGIKREVMTSRSSIEIMQTTGW